MKTKIFKGDHPFSSPYGWRTDPITGEKAFHNGVDFSMPTGEDLTVPDTFNGAKVRLNTKDSYGGIYIQLKRNDGKGCYWLHNSKNLLKVGTVVHTGDVVAKSGNSGNSTGPHVHFGVQSKATVWNSHEDPMPYLTLDTGDMEDFKNGDRMKIVQDMNARDVDLVIVGTAKAGAVGTVISFYKKSGDYDYYKVEFADTVRYLANTTYNEKTEEKVTNLDGSEADDCKAEIEALEAQIKTLNTQLSNYKKRVEELEPYEEFYKGLATYLELKKVG